MSCLDTLYDSYQSTLAGVSLEDYTSYAFGNSFKDFYDTDYPWYDFINTTLEGRGGDSANKQSVALRTVNVRKGAVGLMMLHALDTLDNAIAMDNECSKYEWDKVRGRRTRAHAHTRTRARARTRPHAHGHTHTRVTRTHVAMQLRQDCASLNTDPI